MPAFHVCSCFFYLIFVFIVKHFAMSALERCYVNELTFLQCPLNGSMCVQAVLRCVCMWLCVWAQASLRGSWIIGTGTWLMPSLSLTLITAEVLVIALVTILSSTSVVFQPDQDDTITKPESISCNCAFSKVLYYSISVHPDVWMCVGRGKQQPCQLL